ncbi:MAG: hypothetical protein JNL08_11880 [Planctomycetes bacterium]|nr:hypothetical protein [Planctomycetota bacterium]
MDPRTNRSTRLCALAGLLAAACGGGSNVSNASPRIDEVPLQSTTGGTFTLDLGDFVSDREGAPLTYAVATGGGSFAGDTYSNTFDSMGEHDVEFTVSDGAKTTTGTFRVRVTSANFAVVQEDTSGLLLLDSGTESFVRIAAASAVPTFVTGLGDGRAVYHVAASSGQQLWVYDPMERRAVRLGADEEVPATYRAKTSDNRIVYTTGSGNDQHLFVWNPLTGLARDIAQGVLSSVTVLVNSSDLVFYEVGSSGQADVYGYDLTEDETFVVGDAATDEQLQDVLPNGGVVFTRIGTGGEADLFYYRVATGLVEIGSDVSAIAAHNKVYHDHGTASQVVFAARTGVVSDIYAWDPANGQSTSISGVFTAGSYDLFSAIGAGNEVVLQRVVSGTEVDAFFYDLDSATSATVRNSNDISAVLAVTSDGTTAWALVLPSGATSSLLATSLIATPVTQTWAAGGAVDDSVSQLTNGDVVAVRADGGALNVFDVSAGTWGTAITGTGLAFGGNGIDAGDFVYELTVASQTDLSMWDASATASVVVSDTTGDDAFAARTLDGTILFTRIVGTNTNTDLFVWDGTDATQLTDEGDGGLRHDHAVRGTYAGSR